MNAVNAIVGQWIKSALLASSTSGVISPSDSIFTPVMRPSWPMNIDTDMPAKKPTRIGRDRKVANTPSRNILAARQMHPTPTARSAAIATRSTAAPAGIPAMIVVMAAAITVMDAASGPTVNRREAPKIA